MVDLVRFHLDCLSVSPQEPFSQEPVESMRISGMKPLLFHNDHSEDLETPLHYFDSWITPQDDFFVRQHSPRPHANEDNWRLTLNGSVSRATDTGGSIQLIEATWNPSGYLRNAIDRVHVIVEEQ